MKAIALKTEMMTDRVGIDVSRPRLSWNGADDVRQTAWEIRAYAGDRLCWSSGRVSGGAMSADFGAALRSRERVCW